MYHLQLLEEVRSTLPFSAAQEARVARAIAECGDYQFSATAAQHDVAGCIVHTPSGGCYLCFENGECSCPDWNHRGPVFGDGQIQMCKHTIAAYICGEFTHPVPARETVAA